MSSTLDMARRVSAAHALDARRELGVAMNEPVDVYDAIHRSSLWLMFQPLDRLYGLYERSTNAAGVVINVKVHPALQRFTAAHELGHHVLGHNGSLDPEDHIQGFANLELQELEAQFFAAEFLMPIAAVNAIAAELGVDRASVTAEDIYQVSLRLRTSYLATVNRLQMLEWFGSIGGRRLREIAPKEIKRAMLRHPLQDLRSDVWRVSRATSHVHALVGDSLRLTLAETPSSGYWWRLKECDALWIDHDEFVPSSTGSAVVVGGQGARVIEISAPKADHVVIHGVLSRKWQPDEITDEFKVVVDASPRPEPGLYAEQLSGLVNS